MDNQTRSYLNLQKHIADQDHIIRVRNAEIATLRKRAEKAEGERDRLRAEVVKAKMQAQTAYDDAIYSQERANAAQRAMHDAMKGHDNADTGIDYLDQPTLTAIANLGDALDTLSREWPRSFDIDIAVKSSGEQIARWHQEDGVTEWYFGHKEQS